MQRSLVSSCSSPYVRDIAWILELPDLVVAQTGAPFGRDREAVLATAPPVPVWTSADRLLPIEFFPALRSRMASQLTGWDADDRAIIAEIGEQYDPRRRGRRLGLYYERLLEWLFRHDSRISLVAANVPVQDVDRTRGQLDFVIDYEGTRYHLEVAIKFYLQIGAAWNTAALVGTDLRDRMDEKLAHMVFSQRVTGRSVAGQRALRACCGRPNTDAQVVSMRGVIFPHARPSQDVARTWLTRAEFMRYVREATPDRRWTVVRRAHWFAPLRWNEAEWQNGADLELEALSEGIPTVTVAGAPDGCDETERVVIVRNAF